MNPMNFEKELARRRTFAIIAHPDAGKTTLTEKLLLFGGAIQTAGAVKNNKIKKATTSDFMEIEKQRGISVATSVMTFEYNNLKINILDTPGHKDFAEDTYRTLTAVDSVILVIDCVKGVEEQTEKLMEVCRMRKTPVIIFVNKMDREGQNPFDLLDELENKLSIRVRPITWPVNGGSTFKGVYHLLEKKMNFFAVNKTKLEEDIYEIPLDSAVLDEKVGTKDANQLREDVEMIEGIYDSLNVVKTKKIQALMENGPVDDVELQKIMNLKPRIEKLILKDAKIRTFIADSQTRGKLVSHVYDITYGLVRNHEDTLVLLDDSIVRGTTLKDSIIQIAARLKPKKTHLVAFVHRARLNRDFGHFSPQVTHNPLELLQRGLRVFHD